MTLKQLRYFLAVLRAGSFTAAAESVHVAQPALGVQIRALEDELGVELLKRHSRGVAPTAAGERLARQAVGLIGHAEQVRRDIMEMDGEPHGRIAVGLTGTAVPVLATRLAAACRREYPDLDLTVIEATSHRLADWLTQGQLDVAVTGDPPESPGVVSEALTTEPLFFVAAPGHVPADGPDMPLRAALGAALVVPPEPSTVHGLLADAARSSGTDLRVFCVAESVTAMKDMARCGVACAVMPYGAIRQEAEDGRLAALRIVEPPLARTLYLTCPQDRSGSTAVRAVCREIRALVAGSMDSGAQEAGPIPITGPPAT